MKVFFGRLLYRVVVASLFIPSFCYAGSEVAVRGRIRTNSSIGLVPYARAKVMFCTSNRYNCTSDATNADGMYFMYIPPGKYSLWVDGKLCASNILVRESYGKMQAPFSQNSLRQAGIQNIPEAFCNNK